MTFGLVNGLEKKFKIVLMNEKGESWKIHLRRQAKPDGRFYMIGENVPKKKRQKIEAAPSSDQSCFEAIVTTSNLRTDSMYIPKKFAVSNGLIENHQIDLMNEHGKSWTLYLRYEANRKRCNMSRGWRSFCVANGKKPGDIFNLKLVRNEERPVLKLLPMNLHKIEPSNDTRQDTEKSFLV
ncbi:unnamed protein product [Thlaspi arvense]|uniref:TF-B3 domain-containing protein n=1 Tax=Thlaspi arvense TaxID=13288 RepID=A0AAU9SA00_THLAR|nr:unnamed protein product [Thlaspi arvense]